MRKLLPVILALLIFLTACGSNVSDSFNNYLDKSDTYSNKQLPSGATIQISNLARDNDEYDTILSFTPYFDDTNIYTWASLPQKEQKEDMKYIADMVMDYANSNDWDNNYYLMLSFHTAYFSFVYDYETDTLYFPKNIGVLRLMYKEFNTMNAQELLGNERGEEYLVKYNMAEIKHKQIELINSNVPYTVYIDNGKLYQFGIENSKSY